MTLGSNIQESDRSPGQVALLIGTSSHTPKGCEFYPQLGHIPRLQVQSPVGQHTGGNHSMFLSHIDVSLPLSPSPSHQ